MAGGEAYVSVSADVVNNGIMTLAASGTGTISTSTISFKWDSNGFSGIAWTNYFNNNYFQFIKTGTNVNTLDDFTTGIQNGEINLETVLESPDYVLDAVRLAVCFYDNYASMVDNGCVKIG